MSPQPRIRLVDLPSLIWAFTESDFPTFVLPNTGFGLLAAPVAPTLTDCIEVPNAISFFFQAAPCILFNWNNLLVFDLVNRRLPESVAEDMVNNPWRPLPRGQINIVQARQLLLGAVPAVWAVSSILGAGAESALILLLTWMYNDLHGGDELTRDLIIAIGYDLFLVSSLRTALTATGTCMSVGISTTGYQWRGMIAGVIAITMQIKDLKDQFVVFWSIACILFWQVSLGVSAGTVMLGTWIGICFFLKREDVGAWRWRYFWLLALQTLPVWHLQTSSHELVRVESEKNTQK
ncbi:hypothetical protein BDV12DRAFT_189051 [Aspergillus spectabilis]